MPWPSLRLVDDNPRRDSPRPAAPDDVRGWYRLRRLIEPELAAESCLLLQPTHLDELRRRIPEFADDSDNLYAAHRGFQIELLRPAASRWDLNVLRPLWENTDSLAQAGFGRHGRSPDDVTACVAGCHDLLDAYSTRNPALARAACVRYLNRAERIVERLVLPTN
ncbi:FCD domain-containing protein [Pseudonocardia acaciae]|uniref:FCD domain-containing protein n=1 Tax=Pseudonocardia acaciae TaxID=551276 RepID=UPI000686CA67|nr:FCD domain-containing protein [Pseudonocardia acaciae]